jgi:hypothetical protein
MCLNKYLLWQIYNFFQNQYAEKCHVYTFFKYLLTNNLSKVSVQITPMRCDTIFNKALTGFYTVKLSEYVFYHVLIFSTKSGKFSLNGVMEK